VRRRIYEIALVIAAVVFLVVPPGQATAEESALPQPTSYVTVIAVPDYVAPVTPPTTPDDGDDDGGGGGGGTPPTPTPTTPPTAPEPEPDTPTPPAAPGTVDLKDLITPEGVIKSNIVVTTYVTPNETPTTPETPGTPGGTPTTPPTTPTTPAPSTPQQFAQVIIPAGTTVQLDSSSTPEEVASAARIEVRTVLEDDLEQPDAGHEDSNKLPDNSENLGDVWQIEAGGLQFNQPVQVTLSYSEVVIPPGYTENDIIMITDSGTGWQPVPDQSTDAAENVVTAEVRHFSYFALIVYTTPADIGVRDLEVTPNILRAGEIVTVSVRLLNSGDAGGDYSFSIQIEGGEEQLFSVPVEGRQSQVVTVSTARFKEGVYRVKAGDLERTFTVVGETGSLSPLTPPEAHGFNYLPLIIGLTAVVVALIGYLLYRRRRGGGAA
jgi:hypothetical protein